MSITDELRDWMRARGMMAKETFDQLTAIADRIDAEHEADVSTACRLAAGLDNDALSKRGYIALPVDADGVPIRVGDEMENIVCPSVHREVTGVGVECFYGFDEGNGRYSQFGANCYRHHRAPTVEDVLRECIANVCKSNAQLYQQGCSPLTMEDIDEELDEYINEYAVRLRLAEEVDA